MITSSISSRTCRTSSIVPHPLRMGLGTGILGQVWIRYGVTLRNTRKGVTLTACPSWAQYENVHECPLQSNDMYKVGIRFFPLLRKAILSIEM